jgi:DMSO reductase anchor subunit
MLPLSLSLLLMAKAASTNSAVQWLGWADGVVFVYDCHSAYSFDMIPRYRDGATPALCFVPPFH